MSFVVASVFVSSNICGSLMNASYASKCADSSYGTRRRDEDESRRTTGVFFLLFCVVKVVVVVEKSSELFDDMKEFVTSLYERTTTKM